MSPSVIEAIERLNLLHDFLQQGRTPELTRVATRLVAKVQVDPITGCWQWTASKDRKGYGRMKMRGADRLAHRVALELADGPIPDGLTVDHLCRNHGCVNPAHLEAVTMRENVLRGVGPAAVNARKTHCPRGHEYTPDNIYRKSRAGGRACATCKRAQVAARYWAQREAS